jgi:hypothetical protein
VFVSGFAHLEYESYGLYLSESDYAHSLWKNAVGLGGVSKETRGAEHARWNDRYVDVMGTFNAQGVVGRFSGTLQDIKLYIPRDERPIARTNEQWENVRE